MSLFLPELSRSTGWWNVLPAGASFLMTSSRSKASNWRLCLPLLPQEAPAYSSLAPRLITYHRMEPDAALLLFALCCLVLFRLEKSSRSA